MRKSSKNAARTERRVNAGLVAAGKCGRGNRSKQRKNEWCTKTAGWGTDHAGSGACRLHGGCNPIKHGYDSEIIRERLGDSFQRFKDDPNIATVDGEVAILRGIVEKAIKDGKEGEDVASLTEKVVRAVETMGKIKAKFGITMETLNYVTSRMGTVVEEHVKDADILRAIEDGWKSIVLP